MKMKEKNTYANQREASLPYISFPEKKMAF
jgi:hypothetical protein